MKKNTKNMLSIDSNAQAKFMAYIIYMIVGSYFKATNCLMQDFEYNLECVYVSGTEKLQMFMEDRCISFVEELLLPKLPLEFINEIVNVTFLEPDKNGRRAVCFEAEGYRLVVKAKYSRDPYFIADLYIDIPSETDRGGEAPGEGAAA